MSLHVIMQGLSTTSCKWTASGSASTAHIPASDSIKRRELLEEFILWYFGSFAVPLLRASGTILSLPFPLLNRHPQTTFYITESSAFKNKVLYFRQDDWDVLCAPLIERLTSVTFSKLEEVLSYPMFTCRMFTSAFKYEAEELLRQRKLGFSFVRLLPKGTGVRPIVNLRRKRAEVNVSQITWPCIQNLRQCTLPQFTGENERAPAIHQ